MRHGQCLLFLSIISYASGYVVQFEVPVKFADSNLTVRLLSLDLTTVESFVFDYRSFNKSRLNAFDPSASKKFKNKGEFKGLYSPPYNKEFVSTSGILGKDKIEYHGHVFKGEFGVVDRDNNNYIHKGIDGKERAGRLGFSRGDETWADLREKFLKGNENKSLCLVVREYRSAVEATVSIGDPIYKPDEIVSYFNASFNNNGHWRVPLTSIQIGDYEIEVDTPGILSTSTDEIGFPKRIFNSVIAELRAVYYSSLKAYIVSCANRQPLRIGVNSTEITIDPSSYMKRVGLQCALRLSPVDQSIFILGGPFYNRRGVCMDFEDYTITLFRPVQRIYDGSQQAKEMVDDAALCLSHVPLFVKIVECPGSAARPQAEVFRCLHLILTLINYHSGGSPSKSR
ncbi:unnamed protein product [Bursaphelenchus xylophilus]|uniref:(pine wood nematode) hypothetical protein n=1 Tax=Bursaphelenchus xylophilus TaxID=6326 RepID=A0A1I7SR22_BURXY|nr:unnamed protein product [Bursaphelenchus xylophilus]CAG9110719.1 unnamed protein product [Bursaphelenchus xylophilus]